MPDDSDPTLQLPDPGEELELVRAELAGEYEVLDELGRGGMAVVYLAREIALDRLVAVKVLPQARTFDPALVERFQREARLAASLEHPNIVPIYRVGQSGRVSYFAMKLVRGDSLADLLRQRGRLPPDEITTLLHQVGRALAHAHAHGVVHRDVKPDNIMKDDTGQWVVMDFGIARPVEGSDLTREGGSVGTPRYMSPEQAKGGALDGRSDFYSLGVVAYHALTGQPPFAGDDPMAILYAHLHDAVPEPELSSEAQASVFALLRGLLAKRPEDRDAAVEALVAPGKAQAVEDAEARAAAPPDVALRVATASPGQALVWLRSRGRKAWIAVGIAVLLVVALLGRDPASAQCREALGEEAEGRRAVLVEPPGTVEQAADVDVAFTVCGLSEGVAFRGRLTVRPADGGGVVGGVRRFFTGGEDPVRLTWDDEAEGFGTSRVRSLDLSDLDPGAYRLSVAVESDVGDAEGSQDFTVVER